MNLIQHHVMQNASKNVLGIGIAVLTLGAVFVFSVLNVYSASFATLDPFTQSELDNNWGEDRQFPSDGVTSVSAFGRDDVARIGIDSGETEDDTFRRTEGIKNPPGPSAGATGNFGTAVQVDLYVDSDWEDKAVRAGFWVVGDDGAGDRDDFFGILEFVHNEDHEGWRFWDSVNGWTDLNTSFSYGEWVTLGIELDTDAEEYNFYIDDVLVGSGPGGENFIREVFLNSYNYGLDTFPELSNDSYSAHWHVGTVDYCDPSQKPGGMSIAQWLEENNVDGSECFEYEAVPQCGALDVQFTRNDTPYDYSFRYVLGTTTPDIGDWEGDGTLPVSFTEDENGGSVDITYYVVGPEEDYFVGFGMPNIWDGNGTTVEVDTDCDQGPQECTPGNLIFQIGDDEASQLDHPQDEFSWNGVFGDFSLPTDDPFVVGTSSTDHFPWNSNYDEDVATDFDVEFNYAGPAIPEAKLTVAWSPGRTDNETKEIYLDGNPIGSTSHLGTPVAGWYEDMRVFDDMFTFALTPGNHTLTFEHTEGDGTLWDYVELVQCEDTTPQCEPQQEDWADTVVGNLQGTKKNGQPITDSLRTDPSKTLGPADGLFYSLGKPSPTNNSGWIIVSFDQIVSDVTGDDLSIHELTNNPNTYPEETAQVEVSQDGNDWYLLTEEASNHANESGAGVTLLDFSETGLAWIQYVRITDTTNFDLHSASADGFDLDAVDATQTVCEPPQETWSCENPDSGLLHLDVESGLDDESDDDEAILYEVDETTGSSTELTRYDGVFNGTLAVSASSSLYAIKRDDNGTFVELFFDGSTDDIGPTGLTYDEDHVVAMEFAPDGTLYAMNEGTDDLYEIDTNTGSATLLHAFGGDLDVHGGDLVVVEDGTIFYTRSSGDVYEIDSDTYDVDHVSFLTDVTHITGTAYKDGLHYAFDRDDDFYVFTPGESSREHHKAGPFAFGDGSFCPAEPEGEQCEDVSGEIVSDSQTQVDGGNATSTFEHDNWTADIPGATWIWESEFVSDPENEQTLLFTREFDWDGDTDVSAILDIATDNTYTVWLNGTEVGSSTDSDNYSSADSYDVSSELVDGTNLLEVEVTNLAQPNGTPESNPAGLLYKLSFEGLDCELPDDEEPEPTSELIVVKQSSLQGWDHGPETNDPTGSFIFGPDTAPLGDGSFQMLLDDLSDGYALGYATTSAIRLVDIEDLSYSTFVATTSPGTDQAIALQFNIDEDVTDADNSWKGRLVYEPYQSGETITKGVWQTWDPLAGEWWASGSPINGLCPQADTCTLSEILAVYPDAGIHPTLGGILFKAGSGWSGFEGSVDNFSITVDSHTTTYDFEPEEMYTLTLNITGDGTGTVLGNDIDCHTENEICEINYSASTTIELEADPDAGSTFNNSWSTNSGNAGSCTGTNSPCTLTLNGTNPAVSLNAHFTPNGGGGGSTTSGGGGGSADDDEVASGIVQSRSTGQVLGQQVAQIPAGAPNTGMGGGAQAATMLPAVGTLAALLFGRLGLSVSRQK